MMTFCKIRHDMLIELLGFLLGCCCFSRELLFAQTFPTRSAPSTSTSLDHVTTTLSLIVHRGRFYLPVRTNGQDAGLFIVDTGSSDSGINRESAAKLKLTPIGQKTVDAFSGPEKEDLVLLDRLEFGPIKLHDVLAFGCGCPTEILKDGRRIVGRIGMDVLGRQPFAINFREETLSLYDPASFVPPQSQTYELRQGVDTPRILASIEGEEGWFEIDTGYSENVLLSTVFIDQHLNLVLGRPQIHAGWNWGDKSSAYYMRWKSSDILGQHLDEENGCYDTEDRLGRRIAGLIGPNLFRESILTIDMSNKHAWRESLAPETLAVLVQRLQTKPSRDLANLSALYQAAVLNRPDAVQRLLELGEAPDEPEEAGVTALMIAAARGENDVVEMLLSHGAKVDIKCQNENLTALLFASRYGRLDCVKRLLAGGADVNSMTTTRRTPLFLAAEAGYLDLAQFLLDNGAKVDQELITDETPLLAACSNGNTEIASLLLSHGANPNAAGRRGTCLSYAAGSPSPECVKLLLTHGADPNRRAEQGTSPLMAAAVIGSKDAAECVRLLLNAGADPKLRTEPNATSPNGKSAFDLAIERGHIDAVKLLLPFATPSSKPSTP